MKARTSQGGFTLIELLVVLAIVGSVSAMVAPNLWNSYQRSSERQQILAYSHDLMELRRQAHFLGESLSIEKDTLINNINDPLFPNSPEGWVIERQSPIYFLPTGVTNGASILFTSPTGRKWELSIQSLDGKVSIASL